MAWKVKKIDRETRKISLGEILDALIENGLPKARGDYWRRNDNYVYGQKEFEVGSACAIGQAALNLGVHYSELDALLGEIKYRKTSQSSLGTSIIEKNDGSNWEVSAIGEHYKKMYARKLNQTFDINIEYEVVKE